MKKFDLDRAKEALHWIECIVGEKLNPEACEIKDHHDVKIALKDGQMLCRLFILNLNQCKFIADESAHFIPLLLPSAWFSSCIDASLIILFY